MDITKEDCKKWLVNKTINPVTGKKIKENGPKYIQLLKACEKLEISERILKKPIKDKEPNVFLKYSPTEIREISTYTCDCLLNNSAVACINLLNDSLIKSLLLLSHNEGETVLRDFQDVITKKIPYKIPYETFCQQKRHLITETAVTFLCNFLEYNVSPELSEFVTLFSEFMITKLLQRTCTLVKNNNKNTILERDIFKAIFEDQKLAEIYFDHISENKLKLVTKAYEINYESYDYNQLVEFLSIIGILVEENESHAMLLEKCLEIQDFTKEQLKELIQSNLLLSF